MRLFSDSIGRKVVMAISGLLMVLFVIGHLLGNLTIYLGASGLNSYAQHLHELAPVVWATRIVMGAAVLFHIFISIVITRENTEAKPDKYAVHNQLRSTWASRNMIWTGTILGAFILYHLIHFTFRLTPDVAAFAGEVPGDVYRMVTTALHGAFAGIAYLVAMFSLFFHLSHGIQSVFQTLGLSNAFLLPRWGMVGKTLSAVFLVGFASIPAVILAGIIG
jgi:succinate dehydrogenase / fumarate reductase cytochrome b subunit